MGNIRSSFLWERINGELRIGSSGAGSTMCFSLSVKSEWFVSSRIFDALIKAVPLGSRVHPRHRRDVSRESRPPKLWYILPFVGEMMCCLPDAHRTHSQFLSSFIFFLLPFFIFAPHPSSTCRRSHLPLLGGR